MTYLYKVCATIDKPKELKGCGNFPLESKESRTVRKLGSSCVKCLFVDDVCPVRGSSSMGRGTLISPTDRRGATLSRAEICMS